eukprot:jgi/Bigna1/134396/aug1.25_g9104
MSKETLVKLATLGFVDEDENMEALEKAGGDVDKAIKILNGAAAEAWNEERRDIAELMEKGGSMEEGRWILRRPTRENSPQPSGNRRMGVAGCDKKEENKIFSSPGISHLKHKKMSNRMETNDDHKHTKKNRRRSSKNNKRNTGFHDSKHSKKHVAQSVLTRGNVKNWFKISKKITDNQVRVIEELLCCPKSALIAKIREFIEIFESLHDHREDDDYELKRWWMANYEIQLSKAETLCKLRNVTPKHVLDGVVKREKKSPTTGELVSGGDILDICVNSSVSEGDWNFYFKPIFDEYEVFVEQTARAMVMQKLGEIRWIKMENEHFMVWRTRPEINDDDVKLADKLWGNNQLAKEDEKAFQKICERLNLEKCVTGVKNKEWKHGTYKKLLSVVTLCVRLKDLHPKSLLKKLDREGFKLVYRYQGNDQKANEVDSNLWTKHFKDFFKNYLVSTDTEIQDKIMEYFQVLIKTQDSIKNKISLLSIQELRCRGGLSLVGDALAIIRNFKVVHSVSPLYHCVAAIPILGAVAQAICLVGTVGETVRLYKEGNLTTGVLTASCAESCCYVAAGVLAFFPPLWWASLTLTGIGFSLRYLIDLFQKPSEEMVENLKIKGRITLLGFRMFSGMEKNTEFWKLSCKQLKVSKKKIEKGWRIWARENHSDRKINDADHDPNDWYIGMTAKDFAIAYIEAHENNNMFQDFTYYFSQERVYFKEECQTYQKKETNELFQKIKNGPDKNIGDKLERLYLEYQRQ